MTTKNQRTVSVTSKNHSSGENAPVSERQAFAERMVKLLASYGTASSLAKAVGVSEGAIRKWLHGQAEPGRDNLVALARAANVSVAWLATGQEPMRPEDLTDDFIFFETTERDENAPQEGGNFEPVDVVAFKASWLAEHLGIRESQPYLICARGDAMSPTVTPGDLVMIDTRRDSFGEDGIYLLEHSGRTLLRRAQVLFDGSVVLSSDNKIYKEQTVSPADVANIRVIGRVVWTGKSTL